MNNFIIEQTESFNISLIKDKIKNKKLILF